MNLTVLGKTFIACSCSPAGCFLCTFSGLEIKKIFELYFRGQVNQQLLIRKLKQVSR